LLAALLFGAYGEAAAAVQIPAEAVKWRSTLIREIRYSWGLSQDPANFFAQVHQESNWRANARSRFAAGLTQFTPDTARGMQAASRLRELCTNSGGCPLDPAWALRAMVTYDRSIWKSLEKSFYPGQEQLAATLAGYNGGVGWVRRERDACRAVPGCDPGKWFAYVERHCLRAAWACEESRHYPRVILHTIAPRYRAWLNGGLR
jgi:soluble lytic murein transglycosylase-like protein